MSESASKIFAFSAEHVVRLTGLSKSQLQYWDRTGFFSPRYAVENRRSPFSRIYSFEDVVGLRTLGILRNEHKIPLQTLRRVARKLSQHMKSPWSGLVLYVRSKEVYFREPKSGGVVGALSGQYAVDIALERVARDVDNKANGLKRRAPTAVGKIVRNRYVQHNAWVLAGTRIPTGAIWRFHQAGYAPRQIIEEYPTLTEQDVAAAIKYERELKKSA